MFLHLSALMIKVNHAAPYCRETPMVKEESLTNAALPTYHHVTTVTAILLGLLSYDALRKFSS
jgi:hypothetical protein